MKQILFVDDEINVLDGIRRGLHSMRGEWQMEFADSPERAIEILHQGSIDAVVTDIRMRQMDGFELLKQAREVYPQIVRVVLSGQTEQDALVRSLDSTHLFLGKPCDTEMLKRRLRDLLRRGDKIPGETLKSLIVQLGGMPSSSLLFSEVAKLFKATSLDLNRIAETVSMDIGMSSTVLHFVNSGYFGPATVTSSPERAVRWLGLETVRELIIENRFCVPFDASGFQYFDALNLWSRSISMATAARSLARAHSNDSVLADDAFAAGMFQDLGQLALASVLGQFYDSVVERSISRGEALWKTEREMIGATHAEIGAYLLDLWGMPDEVVNAVATHHVPYVSGINEFSALTAVRIADAMGYENACKTRS